MYKTSLGKDKNGKEVYLKDIWPSNKEIEDLMLTSLNAEMFKKRYSNVSRTKRMERINTVDSDIYDWEQILRMLKNHLFSTIYQINRRIKAITDARILLILGDTITTDHISPAGSIDPTGDYFMKHQIQQKI